MQTAQDDWHRGRAFEENEKELEYLRARREAPHRSRSHHSVTRMERSDPDMVKKSEFLLKEKEAKEYEERCQSMTQKVGSLVKFLEEERSLRKKAELERDDFERELKGIDGQVVEFKDLIKYHGEDVKGLQENILKMKEENDRLRKDKVDQMDEK